KRSSRRHSSHQNRVKKKYRIPTIPSSPRTQEKPPTGRLFYSSQTLGIRLFQHPFLQLLLATDAVPGPGHGFEAFCIDVISATDALTENTFPDARQRVFHHLQQLAFVVALMEQELLSVGIGGTIRDVLRGAYVCISPILLVAGHDLTQLLLPLFQLLTECLD